MDVRVNSCGKGGERQEALLPHGGGGDSGGMTEPSQPLSFHFLLIKDSF